MFKIKEITEQKMWSDFLDHTYKGFYPFFQSWEWGEVQKELGFSIDRLGLFHEEALVGIVLVIEIKAKRGQYLHLRHGPVVLDVKEYLPQLIDYAKKLAKERGAAFLRVSPLIDKTNTNVQLLTKLGGRPAPIHNMDAEICWVLPITDTAEDILKRMRKSHRYLIRKSETLPIEIITSSKPEDIEQFLPLYAGLSVRKHFVAHKGLREEFTSFVKEGKAMLFLAKFDGKIIAGALISFVGNMAIYRHGASDEAYRHIPASYMIQWHAILEAKKRGKTLYNFYGIAPTEDKTHPWYGLTLFKTGFGGEKREFLHAMDIPLRMIYWKSFLIDTITKIKKGY